MYDRNKQLVVFLLSLMGVELVAEFIIVGISAEKADRTSSLPSI